MVLMVSIFSLGSVEVKVLFFTRLLTLEGMTGLIDLVRLLGGMAGLRACGFGRRGAVSWFVICASAARLGTRCFVV